MEINKLIDSQQHQFRPGTVGVDFIESIINSTDRVEKVEVIFMSLMVFQYLFNVLMITEIELYIREPRLSWFELYFYGRKHFVKLLCVS